jgi:hypothetical protein
LISGGDIADDDYVYAVLVAAVVTEHGAEPGKRAHNRRAALHAAVFRILPRERHADRSASPLSPQFVPP